MKTLLLVGLSVLLLACGSSAEHDTTEDVGPVCAEEVDQSQCCITDAGTQGIHFPAVYGPCVALCTNEDDCK